MILLPLIWIVTSLPAKKENIENGKFFPLATPSPTAAEKIAAGKSQILFSSLTQPRAGELVQGIDLSESREEEVVTPATTSPELRNAEKYDFHPDDAALVGAACDIISSSLKNPSSAIYNDCRVWEKDSYGRAIVMIDCFAQNSFGGWNREVYYVCVQGISPDGERYYPSRSLSYVDRARCVDMLKRMNGFGSECD